jgi:hypothetical protein
MKTPGAMPGTQYIIFCLLFWKAVNHQPIAYWVLIKLEQWIDKRPSQYSMLVGFSAGHDCLENQFIFA